MHNRELKYLIYIVRYEKEEKLHKSLYNQSRDKNNQVKRTLNLPKRALI
jgi:hypothetical protein